jgi:hypothetical protein
MYSRPHPSLSDHALGAYGDPCLPLWRVSGSLTDRGGLCAEHECTCTSQVGESNWLSSIHCTLSSPAPVYAFTSPFHLLSLILYIAGPQTDPQSSLAAAPHPLFVAMATTYRPCASTPGVDPVPQATGPLPNAANVSVLGSSNRLPDCYPSCFLVPLHCRRPSC